MFYTVSILQQTTAKPPNIIAHKKVLIFMRNPRLANILVINIAEVKVNHSLILHGWSDLEGPAG